MEDCMQQSWVSKTIKFLLSQTVSLFGSSLVQYAIIWHITLQTQSGVMMMISIICGFLPGFFISPFAGVWADRYNRKMLIVVSDAVIALSTLVLAFLFMAGHNAIWLLFVISAVRSFGTGVQTPSVGAFLPQIVPQKMLMRVNGINSTIQSLAMLVSPMLGAVLYTYISIEDIFLIDVATAAIAIFILLFLLKVPAHQKAQTKQSIGYFTDMRLGLAYIRSHGYIVRFMLFSTIFFFLVSPAAFLTPLQVVRSFGEEVWRLSAIEIAFSLGMALGGFVMSIWGGLKNRVHTMAFAGVMLGVCTLAMGIVPLFSIYLLVMGVSGLSVPVYNTPSNVMLQERVEGNYLGRVFGIFGMIAHAVMPLGMLLFGPLAEVIDIEWLLIGTGALIVCVFSLMPRSKVLVQAGWPADQDEIK